MTIRSKIFILTLSVMIPVVLIISFLEINSVIDKSIYYMEREMFSKELAVVRSIHWLRKRLDEIVSNVSEIVSSGRGYLLEYEGVMDYTVYPLGDLGVPNDVLKELNEAFSQGFAYKKIVRVDGKRYLVLLRVSNAMLRTAMKDISRSVFIQEKSGKIVFPDEIRGLEIEVAEPADLGYTIGRIGDLFKKYGIKLMRVGNDRYYVLPIDQVDFPNYRFYVVLEYKKAIRVIMMNMFWMFFIDAVIVLGAALLTLLYIRSLTRPIENLVYHLTRKKQERDYTRLEIDAGSKDLQELVSMINELLDEVAVHVEELEKSYAKLQELHAKVLETQGRIMDLNRMVNDLMLLSDRKSVLDIAIREIRDIFPEIDEVCYEVIDEMGSMRNGRCNMRNVVIELEAAKSKYKFFLDVDGDIAPETRHILELFLNMVVTVAENRNLWSQVEDSYFYLTRKLSEISEVYDDETGQHIKRVGEYCALISKEMGMDSEFVEKIRMFSQLHDIGKLRVPRSILMKAQPLTPEEFEQMKKHTIYGAEFIGEQPWLRMARNIALYHHENWDGTGYPFGLKGEYIPIEARIVKLADVYDALRSERRYKPVIPHEETVRIILEGDGRTMPDHFDPNILKVFERIHIRFNEIYEMWRD